MADKCSEILILKLPFFCPKCDEILFGDTYFLSVSLFWLLVQQTRLPTLLLSAFLHKTGLFLQCENLYTSPFMHGAQEFFQDFFNGVNKMNTLKPDKQKTNLHLYNRKQRK